jgi:hypothetical protein
MHHEQMQTHLNNLNQATFLWEREIAAMRLSIFESCISEPWLQGIRHWTEMTVLIMAVYQQQEDDISSGGRSIKSIAHRTTTDLRP